MNFKWQGRSYDTTKMEIFETENPAAPMLYVVPRGEVFVVEIERLEGIKIRLVERDEALQLAERHGFSNLLATEIQQMPAGTAMPGPAHALIVEDDGAARHALGRLLQCSGYKTNTAATIAEAEIMLADRPKWLFLDLQLPDGNGATLLERVRSENLPIKIAITTGEDDKDLLLKVQGLNPDIIFRKPLDLSQIMDWLDAA